MCRFESDYLSWTNKTSIASHWILEHFGKEKIGYHSVQLLSSLKNQTAESEIYHTRHGSKDFNEVLGKRKAPSIPSPKETPEPTSF